MAFRFCTILTSVLIKRLSVEFCAFLVVTLLKMVYSTYKRQRILHHYFGGHKAPTIAKLLREEGLKASRVEIIKFLTKFQETGFIVRRLGSGRPSKITTEIKRIVGD